MSSKYFTQTIANGQTDSAGFMTNEDGVRGPMCVLIVAPTFSETITLQVAAESGTFATLTTGEPGVDITLQSGKAKQVMILNACKIRVHSGTPVAADRAFEFLWNVTSLNQR